MLLLFEQQKKNKYSFERVLFSNLFRILTFSNQFMYNFERFQGSEGSKNSTTKKLRMQFIWFLVGAFLEKRVDYSHGFSSVFFFDTPEVTKIVQQVLQNFMVRKLNHLA